MESIGKPVFRSVVEGDHRGEPSALLHVDAVLVGGVQVDRYARLSAAVEAQQINTQLYYFLHKSILSSILQKKGSCDPTGQHDPYPWEEGWKNPRGSS